MPKLNPNQSLPPATQLATLTPPAANAANNTGALWPPVAKAAGPAPVQRWNRRQWLIIVMIALLHGLNHGLYVMMAPLFVPMRDFFGFTELTPILALGTAFLLPYGVSHIGFGYAADRISKVGLLAGSSIASCLCFVGAAIYPHYPVVMAAIVLAGIAAAGFHGVGSALVSQLFPTTKGRALGISGVGAALGLALTPALSGALGETMSWRVVFAIFAGAGVLLAILFWLLVPDPEPHAPGNPAGSATAPSPAGTKSVLKALMPLICFLALREFCGWSSFSLVPSYAQLSLGMSITAAGAVGMCVTLAGLVASPLIGIASDHCDRLRLLAPLTAAAGALIMVLPWLPAAWLAPAALAYGFFYLATVPVLEAAVADRTPDHLKGRVFGAIVSIGIGFGALGPLLTGLPADLSASPTAGFRIGFAIAGASMLLALWSLQIARRRSIAAV